MFIIMEKLARALGCDNNELQTGKHIILSALASPKMSHCSIGADVGTLANKGGKGCPLRLTVTPRCGPSRDGRPNLPNERLDLVRKLRDPST